MNPYEAPIANVQLGVPLQGVRRIAWIILGVCVLFLIAGGAWLRVLYLLSLAQLPDIYSGMRESISQTQDMSVLKDACLTLTRLDESDVNSRRKWIVWAPVLGTALAIICASLSVWLLITTKRIENSFEKPN